MNSVCYQCVSSRISTVHTMLFIMNRFFAIFWLSFCVIVPIIDRFSLRMRNPFKTIGLPITPLWIKMSLVTHAIGFQIIYSSMDLHHGVRNSINELKESNYAFIFTIRAYNELRRNCKQSDFLSKCLKIMKIREISAGEFYKERREAF